MKLIPILVLLYILAGCNPGPMPLDDIVSEDTIYPRAIKQYPDTLIYNEQDKAIGRIKFGISQEEYQIEKASFLTDTKKQSTINGNPVEKNYIGNFEFVKMTDYYDSGKLYRLEIQGAPISWDSYETEIHNRISVIQDLIAQKFGNPDSDNRIPKMDDLKQGSTYLIRTWNIGDKRIEIQVLDGQTVYIPYIAIYKPSVQYRLNMQKTSITDSITKAGKDLF